MPEPFVILLWVAIGSAVGGMARFFILGVVAKAFGETFPWGTLTVNVTGSFVIGVVFVAVQSGGPLDRPEILPLALTGVLGSYTTVSSFSLQTLVLARDGRWLRAGGNVLMSLVLCLSAVAAGVFVAHMAFGGSAV